MKKIAYLLCFVIFGIVFWLGLGINTKLNSNQERRSSRPQPGSISGEFCLTQGGDFQVDGLDSYCLIDGQRVTAQDFFLQNITQQGAAQVISKEELIPSITTVKIPESCVSWFDGCNTCFVGQGEVSGCTKKFCSTQEEARCLSFE